MIQRIEDVVFDEDGNRILPEPEEETTEEVYLDENGNPRETIVIDGVTYVVEETIPGIGFESKEEEEAFIDSICKSFEENDKYDIYSTPNLGVRA